MINIFKYKKVLFFLVSFISLQGELNASEFIRIIDDNSECFIEGEFNNSQFSGYGFCVNQGQDSFGKPTVSMNYGNYILGKKVGIFLQVESGPYITFAEYKNDLRNGFLITLGGADTYFIYQYKNDIEQGISLINYPSMDWFEKFNLMENGADLGASPSNEDIEKFNIGYHLFEQLILETFGWGNIKQYKSDENFSRLLSETQVFINSFADTRKNTEPKTYKID